MKIKIKWKYGRPNYICRNQKERNKKCCYFWCTKKTQNVVGVINVFIYGLDVATRTNLGWKTINATTRTNMGFETQGVATWTKLILET